MQFNPDKNKQAVQVIFSQKKETLAHPPVFFNGYEIVLKAEHKHLGMILDSKLSFQSHVREAIINVRKGIRIIRFLSKYVSRDVLIYHRHDPEFKLEFTKRRECTQYSAALAVSGAWRRTNTDKLYEELGCEILFYKRWYRRLCHFYKLRNNQRPLYLYSKIPRERIFHHNLRRVNVYETNAKSTNRFSHTYFENLREWNQLDESIKSSPTISVFKRELMRLIRPQKRSLFGFHDIEGV